MCNFFSVCSDPMTGKIMYFNSEMRRKIIAGKTPYQSTDSHTSIADYYGYKKEREDKLNKFEYNPLTGRFVVDRISVKDDFGRPIDDREIVEHFCRELDFSTIVPELKIKKIINPLTDVKKHKVTKKDIADLKAWAKVKDIADLKAWAKVRNAVFGAVKYAVGGAVGGAIWDAVWDAVYSAVGGTVWDTVGGAVGVGGAIRGTVVGYTSSFFNIDYGRDYSSVVRLWERGFVPSFDGITWRLHQGPNAEVVYEWKPE